MYRYEVYSRIVNQVIGYAFGDNEEQIREKYPEYSDKNSYRLIYPIYMNCN